VALPGTEDDPQVDYGRYQSLIADHCWCPPRPGGAPQVGDGAHGGGGPTPGGNLQQQITRLLKQALDHFAAADAVLKAGNLALYQSEVNAAQAAIAKANQLAAKAGGTSPSPSPTVTPGSPTPSPSG